MARTKLSEKKASVPMPTCDAGGDGWHCDHPIRRRGNPLCGGHDAQLRRGVELRPLQKQAWGGRPSQKHLPCEFEGCSKLRKNSGLCAGHYEQRKKGQPLRPLRQRPGPHPFLVGWSEPWTYEGTGYAYVCPRGKREGRRLEHRVVMEQILGRPLLPHENVHHLNGVRNDNRPENLELWSTMQPSGQSIADKLRFAREIIALYG